MAMVSLFDVCVYARRDEAKLMHDNPKPFVKLNGREAKKAL